MKNIILSLSLMVFTGTFFVSCECTECYYTSEGVVYSSGEYCGSKSEVAKLQSDWMTLKDDYGFNVVCK